MSSNRKAADVNANSQRLQCIDYAYDAPDDRESTEFRHRIALLPEEEEDLSDAFQTRLTLKSGSSSGGDVTAPVQSRDIERDATINRIKFEKFVRSSYQTKTEHMFVKNPITQPLIAKTNEVDRLASIVLSISIKRYCGDVTVPVSSPKHTVENSDASRVPVISTVHSLLELLAKHCSGSPSTATASEPNAKRNSSFKKLFGGGGGGGGGSSTKHSSSGGANGQSDAVDVLDLDVLSSIPTEEYDLAQFIVGLGILRPELRDEIFCQLCAQVTENPSKDSWKRGWILHALCAGCFLPSDKLLKYYFGFLNDSQSNESCSQAVIQVKYCIHRTSERGQRHQPPNCIEYQGMKSRQTVMLPVLLPDGQCETVEADSATTAAEMCRKIAHSIGLRDRFGFAIYIGIYDKVSSLGQSSDHVMDAISECEQLVSNNGGGSSTKNATTPQWQLFYRKELFTPWHDAECDDVATDLIYRQIVQGVRANEYRHRSEDELLRFIARCWYVENGDKITPGHVHSSLHELVPTSLQASGKSRDWWTQMIISTYNQMGLGTNRYTKNEVKWSIVESGKRKWPLHFSGMFEARYVSGPPLPRQNILIAVSCRGVFLLEEPYKVIIGLHYYELVEVKCDRQDESRGSGGGQGQGLTLITVRGDQWSFVSPSADIISRLLSAFLDGLRRRSRWAVAIENFILQDHTKQVSGGSRSSLFELRHGDVIELMDETTQEALKELWMYGRCERTGLRGSFPYDCVYIIPTCQKPPSEFLSTFTDMSRAYVSRLPRKRGMVLLASQTVGRYVGHGLQSAI